MVLEDSWETPEPPNHRAKLTDWKEADLRRGLQTTGDVFQRFLSGAPVALGPWGHELLGGFASDKPRFLGDLKKGVFFLPAPVGLVLETRSFTLVSQKTPYPTMGSLKKRLWLKNMYQNGTLVNGTKD